MTLLLAAMAGRGASVGKLTPTPTLAGPAHGAGFPVTKQSSARHQQARMKRIALQFLSNIYMSNEAQPTDLVVGVDGLTDLGNGNVERGQRGGVLLPSPGVILKRGGQQADKLSIRVRGKRFKYTKKPARDGSNFVWARSQWQKAVILNGLLDSRMFLSASRGYPTLCYSIRPYSVSGRSSAPSKQKQQVWRDGGSKDFRVGAARLHKRYGNGKSFGHLLCAAWGDDAVVKQKFDGFLRDVEEDPDVSIEEETEWLQEWVFTWQQEREMQRDIDGKYHADYIDDPRLQQGNHKTVITKLAPMFTFSVLRYANHKTIKNELNEDYTELHPWIPPSLTLSKIRNLKRETLEYWFKNNFEMSTLALAVVYFEKLIMRKLVVKANRKLKFAVCLLLAFKFNDTATIDSRRDDDELQHRLQEERNPYPSTRDVTNDEPPILVGVGGSQLGTFDERAAGGITNQSSHEGSGVHVSDFDHTIDSVFSAIQHVLGIGRKEVIKNEMIVFAELGFGLFARQGDVVIHFTKLLHVVELRPKEYLGDEWYDMHFMHVEPINQVTEEGSVDQGGGEEDDLVV